MSTQGVGCYLITPRSVKDLTYWKGKWCLPYEGLTFPSLRVAKVYIKKNKGLLMLKYNVFVDGRLRIIQTQGTLNYD